MFIVLLPEMQNAECKVQTANCKLYQVCHCEGRQARGNLLVQQTEKQCRNKHRTGRFPRRGFAPPRNDMFDGAVQQIYKL